MEFNDKNSLPVPTSKKEREKLTEFFEMIQNELNEILGDDHEQIKERNSVITYIMKEQTQAIFDPLELTQQFLLSFLDNDSWR